MDQKEIRAFTIGTAVWDDVVDFGSRLHGIFNDEKGIFDGKAVIKHSYEQSGGSAINTRLAFQGIAQAFGFESVVHTCTKLGATGPDNPHKERVLNEIGVTSFSDETLMDAAFEQPGYILSKNRIFLNEGKPSEGDEDPDKRHKGRLIGKEHEDITVPLNPTIREEIANAVRKSNVVILHSRYPELAAYAAEIAQEEDIPVILDCSEKTPAIVERLGPLIRLSDYVVAPGGALLPGMKGPFASTLMTKLIEEYCREHVAVSDNNDPVQVYADGEASEIKVEQVETLDTLGIGDARDAALGFFIALGDDFATALEKASAIASFTATFYGREWTEHLAEFVRSYPLFASHFADPEPPRAPEPGHP